MQYAQKNLRPQCGKSRILEDKSDNCIIIPINIGLRKFEGVLLASALRWTFCLLHILWTVPKEKCYCLQTTEIFFPVMLIFRSPKISRVFQRHSVETSPERRRCVVLAELVVPPLATVPRLRGCQLLVRYGLRLEVELLSILVQCL